MYNWLFIETFSQAEANIFLKLLSCTMTVPILTKQTAGLLHDAVVRQKWQRATMTNCLSRNSCGLERSSGNTLGGRASRIVTNCTFLNAILVVYCPPFTTGPSIVNSSEILTTHPPTSGTKSYCLTKALLRLSLWWYTTPPETVFASWEKKRGRSVNQNISLFRSWNVLSIHVTFSLAGAKMKSASLSYEPL